MKRILFLIIIVTSLVGTKLNASHLVGGEITWECKSSGVFVFRMEVYRDCGGIPYSFSPSILNVVGGPRNANNQIITQITMKPDSNKWLQIGGGEIAPPCGTLGNPYSCANGDPGTLQRFMFKSDPIQLKGTPPASGWRFIYGAPCCRSNEMENLTAGGRMGLRATMYRIPNPNFGQAGEPRYQTTNVCDDSSPRFEEIPANFICRGYKFTFNHNSYDSDLDSLIYGWDRPYNAVGTNLTPKAYKNGFTPTNPMPGPTQHSSNIAVTLDAITGQMETAVFSGNQPAKYVTVVKVDAIRHGVVIATIYREIPFVLFDCPTLPSGQINRPPQVSIEGDTADGLIVDVVAGQEVRVGFQSSDLDLTGTNPPLQKITVEPSGFMFSLDRTDPGNCRPGSYPQNLPKGSCAILVNQTPQLNNNISPSKYQISGYTGIATEFVWQTECYHIRTAGTGIPGANTGIYNFVMKTFDDHCPIPMINYPTITVRITDPVPLNEPILKGASVGLDGKIVYQWVPPMDSAFAFERYEVEDNITSNGGSLGPWSSRNSNLQKYQQQKKSANMNIFSPPGDILNKFGNTDWYLRMTTFSGCTGNEPSSASEPVQIMELESTHIGAGTPQDPLKSKVRLDWNRPKPIGAFGYHYFKYESPTHFYVYQSDSVDTPGAAAASVWTFRGKTTDEFMELPSTVCSQKVGFRIEARDTVVTIREGYAPRHQVFDTLTFSTFSTIDTTDMVTAGFPPTPKFDTVNILPNGDVFFRMDLGNAGTANQFNIYALGAGQTLLVNFFKPLDSLVIPAASIPANFTGFELEAVDECTPTNTASSPLYNVFTLNGSFDYPCDSTYHLSWDMPTGFSTNGYKIYFSHKGANGPFTQIGNITAGNITNWDHVGVVADTNYYYKIMAYDLNLINNNVDEDIIGSTVHFVRLNGPLRTEEVVPAPDLRCTEVLTDGSIKLTWLRPTDTTNNFTGYSFDYSLDGVSWNSISQSLTYADTTFTVPSNVVNALNQKVDFRVASVSGCKGDSLSAYNFISSIYLNATTLTNGKDVSVDWNGVTPTSSNSYDLYKKIDTVGMPNPLLLLNTSNIAYTDMSMRDSCKNEIYYRVSSIDPSGCVSVSNINSTGLNDTNKVPMQIVDAITFNVVTKNVEIFWSEYPKNPAGGDVLLDSVRAVLPFQLPQGYETVGMEDWDENKLIIPRSLLDATDDSRSVGLQGLNICGAVSTKMNFHSTMDLDVSWDQCDSSVTLDWNPYPWFKTGEEVQYKVYFDTTGDISNAIQQGFTSDTTFEFKVENGNKMYHFYIEAVDLNGNGQLSSNSNVDSLDTPYSPNPKFTYVHYVSVMPDKEIELQLQYDPEVNSTTDGFVVYRGIDKDNMSAVYRESGLTGTNASFLFYDYDVVTDDYSYFYKVVPENECGDPLDTSNLGRSIHLTVTPSNESMTNVLNWNEYEDWDEPVSYYNIYRGYNGGHATVLHKTVPPIAVGKNNRYVDDVYDDYFVEGQYCYMVEAVQSLVDTSLRNPNPIPPAFSRSNEVCITQQPLFYIPNAFTPGGKNAVFGPKGQFIDFSLYEMVIYNRWGETVFKSNSIYEGWNGVYKGEIAPNGSYVYTIRFVDADGDEHRKKGTVTIIR